MKNYYLNVVFYVGSSLKKKEAKQKKKETLLINPRIPQDDKRR